MGKPTGFMEIDRQTSREIAPEERIKNFNEFHIPLHCDEQQAQGARCMDCGVPFCQSGMLLGGTPIQAAAQSPIPRPAQSEPIGRDAMLDLSGEARRLITEDDVRRAAQRGYRIIRYAPDAILTPLARDIAAEKRIELASAVH